MCAAFGWTDRPILLLRKTFACVASATIRVIGSTGRLKSEREVKRLGVIRDCLPDNATNTNRIGRMYDAPCGVADQCVAIDSEPREHDNRDRLGHAVGPIAPMVSLARCKLPLDGGQN
jgi:hypothetical protein